MLSGGLRHPYGDRTGPAQIALVRICARYFAHAAWLTEGQLIGNAHRLTRIPGVLIHGRFDLGGPPHTAWQLAQAWSQATVHVVDAAGHLGDQRTQDLVHAALDAFASDRDTATFDH